MIAKEFTMFYFDDKTFISLCKQLEKEIDGFTTFSGDNVHDLRLAYQKFELFLSVYYQSRKREDIDYKTEQRMEIASELNQVADNEFDENINDEFYSEHFLNAKEKFERVLEDLIYQITMKNLSANATVEEY